MKIIRPKPPSGFTIFCDDIRHEIGGKVSLIGVYNNVLYFPPPGPNGPAIIHKLAMRVTYFEAPGESDEPVDIKFLLIEGADKQVIVEDKLLESRPEMPSPERIKELTKDVDEEDAAAAVMLTVIRHYELGPFLLAREGRLSVRAYRGDSEIRLGSLQIKPGNSPAPVEGAPA